MSQSVNIASRYPESRCPMGVHGGPNSRRLIANAKWAKIHFSQRKWKQLGVLAKRSESLFFGDIYEAHRRRVALMTLKCVAQPLQKGRRPGN
jgi:hypothetical protein